MADEEPIAEDGDLLDEEGNLLQHEHSLMRAEDAPPPGITRGYYRFIGPDPEQYFKGFARGDLVYVTEVTPETVYHQCGSGRWQGRLTAFRQWWVPAPDGAAERARQMQELLVEMAALSQAAQGQTERIEQFNPHVGATGDLVGGDLALDLAAGEDGEPETALARNPAVTAVEAKRALAQVKNAVTRFKGAIEKKGALLQGYMDEQTAIMNAQVRDLMGVVAKAQEAIWTINLYLGKDEEIHRLAEGAPAGKEEPLAIRQMVLYMDEECAVAAETGGIDARSLGEFDAWLVADPRHRDQVIPDLKGMVALKVRRYMKERGSMDPWLSNKLEEADRQTYFLLRNGENLYRLVTEFNTGETLIPRRDQFLAFFKTKDGDLLEPGTDKYMAAEKAAGAAKRHYMRAALILQGLIDRTTIFHPLPGKFSVGDPKSYEPGGPLKLVQDVEGVLADGHESWQDWISRINEELQVGMRVVGEWGLWAENFKQETRRYHTENERLAPPTGMPPEDEEIYTLEGKKGTGFYFLYRRRKHYASRGEDPFHQNRATCQIMPGDPYLLNLDRAEVAEMRYFLTNRLQRHAYARMFPILKLAIAIKEREAAEEAPFRQLLVGTLMSRYGIDAETAEAALPALIEWWKRKNKNYRALVSRDARDAYLQHAQALTEIVAEYRHRVAAEEQRRQWRGTLYGKLAEGMLRYRPTMLLMAHKEGNEFVVLVPENAEPVFVAEETWVLAGRGSKPSLRIKETKNWRTVDRRYLRWDVFYESGRWPQWQIGASRSEHLTDPERETLAEELLALARPRAEGRRGWHYGTEYAKQFLPAGLTLQGNSLRLYFYEHLGEVPAENPLVGPLSPPSLGYVTAEWGRDVHRVPKLSFTGEDHTISGMDWRHYAHEYGYRREPIRVLKEWPESARIALAREREYQAVKELRDAHEGRIRQAVHSVELQLGEQAEAAAYAEFLAEFGDPDLWEGHRKGMKNPPPGWVNCPWLTTIITRLLEEGVTVEGETVGRLWELYQERTGEHTLKLPPRLGPIGYRVIQEELTPPEEALGLVVKERP